MLRRSIELPAHTAGLRLEPGFADEVVSDVTGRTGALPLLSTALFETWLRRRDRVLTLDAYRATGGVLGSVARLAEDAFLGLSAAQQDAARRLLVRLAEPVDGSRSEGSANPRRVAIDLVARADDVAAWVALERLITRRLLSIDGGSVGLAHEALIREWPRFRQWLEEDIDGRALHRQVSQAAEVWDVGGRDPGDLLRGPRLAAAVDRADRDPARLNDLERSYLDASAALQVEQERETNTRLVAQRRANRRLRVLLGGTAAALVVALLAGAFAVRQGRRADREAGRAEDAAAVASTEWRTADVRRVVAESRSLRSTNLDLALLLALEANRIDDTPETRGAVQAALSGDPRLAALLQGRAAYYRAAYYRAAFTPDGTVLALGATDGSVELWDAAQRAPVGAAWSVPGPVLGVWPAADGGVLVASGDGTVRRLSSTGGETPDPLISVGEEILGADVSPDGATLATMAAAGGTRLWDLGTGQPAGVLIPSRGGLLGGVRFDPTGTMLATAAGDAATGALQLWDRATGTALGAPLAVTTGGTTGVINVAFSPDGGRLAGGASDGSLTVFDVASGAPVQTLSGGHRDPFVYSVAFSPDGTRLVSVGQDGLAVLWDLATGEPIGGPLDGQAGPTHAVAFSPDGTTFVTAGVDGSAAVWDPTGSGSLGRRVGGPPSLAVAYAPGGDLVAARHPDGVRLIDSATGEQRGPTLPSFGFGTLAFNPAGDALAVSALSGAIDVYDVESGAPVTPMLEGHLGPLASMSFSPDGRLLASGGYDEQLIVFDLATGQPVVEAVAHSHWVLGTGFSPDGSLLATTTFDGNLAFYDGRTVDVVEERLNYEGFHGAASVAFSPDGDSFATGAGDGTVTIWDTETRAPRLTSAVHSAAVYGVAWAPDGSVLVTASTDGTSRLIDPATGRPIGDSFPVADRGTVSVNGSGTHVAMSDPSGFVVWSIDPAVWRSAACTLAGRNLTAAEWDEHHAFAGARQETCDQFDLLG